MAAVFGELSLRGGGGEPVDLRRTFASHGVAALPSQPHRPGRVRAIRHMLRRDDDLSAMAEAGDAFYRDVARAGYRGAYLKKLAEEVAGGRVDLEALNDPELPDGEVKRRLLALPGVGPYAAAHIMLMSLGRRGHLILDSWTRPAYGRLSGKQAPDELIRRRWLMPLILFAGAICAC